MRLLSRYSAFDMHGKVFRKVNWLGLSRPFLGWLILVVVSLGDICARAATSAELPNVVIIFMDDMGYADIGVTGAKGYQTPNLDRLAAEGTLFRNFHVAQPVCSASRAALLTGCYPNRLGIHGALGPEARNGLPAGRMTLAEVVKQRGYATAVVGKWHLGNKPEFLPTRHGFDSFFGLPYSNDMWPYHPALINLNDVERRKRYPDLPLYENETVIDSEVTGEDQDQLTTRYTERAVRFIEQNREQPFFLYLAHSMPHVPLHVSDKFRGKTARGLFGDVIEEIDWSVGKVLETIDKLKLRNRTWVIFTSDNGPWLSYGDHAGSALPFREGKGTSWEGGTRVPCIMRWPGQIPAGKKNDHMAMTIDLLPTIAVRIGAALPTFPIDGLDVWPVLAGKRGAKNPHSSYWFYYEQNQLQAVTSGDGRWKLVLPHRYRSLAGKPGGQGGQPANYAQFTVKAPELYDLAKDKEETSDLAAQNPEIIRRLVAEAQKARADLGDALTESKPK